MRAGVAVLAVLAAVAAPAAAAPPPSHGSAVVALHRAQALRAGRGVVTGYELTPALSRLYRSLPALSGPDRRAGEALLERPDDTQQDPPGTHKWSGPEDPHSPWCTAHFCVHWAKTGTDAPAATPDANNNNVPDSIEQMASIFESEVYPCENGTAANACALVAGSGGQMTGSAPGLGWRAPASDNGLGGDNRLDVYIEDLFPSSVFGYVALDPGQPADPAVPHHAYMVMDKDYSRFANGNAAGGLADERVTAAHEYNHVLQNAYDFLQDTWMLESTAVWMEDKVYPAVNDYLQYLPGWVANPGQPLTTFTSANSKPYGSAVWNHWLDHRYGAAVVRAAWEDSVAAANFAPGAYNAAIAGAGGSGFADEFDRFSVAVMEWNAPGSGFPDHYPDVARNGNLPPANVTAPFGLAHTTFASFDVPLPVGAPIIRLMATLPSGTAGALALVARTGSDPNAGTVTSNLTPLPSGGIGAVTLSDPGSFGRITAVVVNADSTTNGFDQNAGDYVFSHDAPSVTAQLDLPGPPVVTTGAAGPLADHAATVAASVDPHLLDSTWAIEYGKTTPFGARTNLQPIPATTLTPAAVTAPLSELDASTVYHYRVIASNSAGQVVGTESTFTTARDVTRPKLTLVLSRAQRIRGVRARGVVFRASASEPCRGTARVELGRRVARRLGLPRLLGVVPVRLGWAQTRTFHVRLRAQPRKRLAQIRRLGVRLAVRVADPSHNATGALRRVTLR